MQHTITRQYARDVEMPLAEFNSLGDANFFLTAKLESDAELHVAAIYRLYKDGNLLNEINRGKINVSGVPTRYFSDEGIQSVHPNAYKVAAQDLVNSPEPCANFIELKDARLFIEKKLPADLTANKKITYRILKSNQMLEKFDPVKPAVAEKQQDNKQGSVTNKATFRPTPFNTVPRPPGSPQGWIKETSREKAGEKEEEK